MFGERSWTALSHGLLRLCAAQLAWGALWAIGHGHGHGYGYGYGLREKRRLGEAVAQPRREWLQWAIGPGAGPTVGEGVGWQLCLARPVDLDASAPSAHH